MPKRSQGKDVSLVDRLRQNERGVNERIRGIMPCSIGRRFMAYNSNPVRRTAVPAVVIVLPMRVRKRAPDLQGWKEFSETRGQRGSAVVCVYQ